MLTSVQNAMSRTTGFSYDAAGHLTNVAPPLGASAGFGYDGIGRLTTVARGNGSVSFVYDGADRVTSKGGSANAQFTYDAVGNLTGASNGASSLAFTVDTAGRVTAVAAGGARQASANLTMTYDSAGTRLALQSTLGHDVSYGYDGGGRLTSLRAGAKTWAFTYDAAGRRTSLTHPNGVVTQYGYDRAGQMTGIVTRRGDVLVAQAGYEYDLAGNRTSLTDFFGRRDFSYDRLQRLLSVRRVGAASWPPAIQDETFTYDAVGNRTSGGATHNAGDQLTQDSRATYGYDANGNVSQMTDTLTNATTTLTWDAENQLTQAILADGRVVQYAYDALGRRTEQNVAGTITQYVYDNEDIIAEVDGAGTVLARYIHGPGIDEPLAMERGGQTYYLHADGLGSIAAITDEAGLIVNRIAYEAYGTAHYVDGMGNPVPGPAVPMPYAFTGRERDPATGLMYYRARYYDPTSGRFLSQDPRFKMTVAGSAIPSERVRRRPMALHKYAYAETNPVLFVDPDGFRTRGCPSNFWECYSDAYEGYASCLRLTAGFGLALDIGGLIAKRYVWGSLGGITAATKAGTAGTVLFYIGEPVCELKLQSALQGCHSQFGGPGVP